MSAGCHAVALRHLLWIVLLVLAGCTTTANQGPIYKLPSLELQAPAAPVAVSVTDKRPANARSYRRGGVQPAEYQTGIEVLTLENFEPEVTEMLKQSFAQCLSTLAQPPVWADVEITRFQVSIDRREILAAAYEEELLHGTGAPGVGVGVGMGAGGGGPGNIVGAVGAGLMAAAVTSQKLQEVERNRSSWDHAMEGVTCEIEVHVQLHWEGGRREEFDLQARSHSIPPTEERFTDLMKGEKWNIAPTVEQGVIQISDLLHKQGELLLRGVIPPKKVYGGAI